MHVKGQRKDRQNVSMVEILFGKGKNDEREG